jgi:hypothetical protein
MRHLFVPKGYGYRLLRLEAMPHPCARVSGSALPPPGWLGEVMAGGAALPRLRWRVARGPVAVEPWAARAGGSGLSSLFVRLSPSAGDGGVWLARSLALLVPLARCSRCVGSAPLHEVGPAAPGGLLPLGAVGGFLSPQCPVPWAQ